MKSHEAATDPSRCFEVAVTDDDAFLKAILADPDDDSPRLIYADWLDEQGQPERAEFIRVQCELARLPEGEPRRGELEARERELLTLHQGAWATDALRPLTGMVTSWWFRRGFIEKVTVEARGVLAHADALFGRAPIRQLGVYLARRRIQSLLVLPHVARLAGLYLSGNSLGGDGVRWVAASPFLGRLTTLGLRYNGMGDEGAETIAASPHLPCLRTLELAVNNIGDAGALALARSYHFPRLVNLDLNGNPIGNEALDVLRGRFGDGLSPSEPPVIRRGNRSNRG